MVENDVGPDSIRASADLAAAVQVERGTPDQVRGDVGLRLPGDVAGGDRSDARIAKPKLTKAAKKRRFLVVLAESGNVSLSAREAGIANSSVYRYRAEDDAFGRAWDEALDTALDLLESSIMQRAREGVERPLVYGGKQIASVRNYSDALAMFILRSRRPEVYGRVGAAIAQAAPDEEEALIAECERRLDRARARFLPRRDDAA